MITAFGTAIATMAAVLGGGEACAAAANAEGTFIAHEWGTFTSFSGSDGVQLEFRPTIGQDLPEFVYDRGEWTGYAAEITANNKLGIESLQRMETPVVYFYSDRQRTANVRVDFPQGLLTEFFPPVRALGPAFDPNKPEPIANSFLDWGKIGIIPVDRLSDDKNRGLLNHPPSLPMVHDKNHYEHARETDAAFVRVCMGSQDYFERFLFYRGVGNFRIPISFAYSQDKETWTLTNRTGEKLSHVFMVVDECCGYSDVQFSAYKNVGETLEMKAQKGQSTIYQVCDQVTRALVESGLYEAEARAMVKTWRDSWFTEPGLRVFYILPRKIVDELLPLKIDPKPTDLVRVFVGRLESLAPQAEQKITEILTNFEKWTPSQREEAVKGLGFTYQRFAEPALRRVAAMVKDPATVRQAQKIIAQLRSGKPSNAAASVVAEQTRAAENVASPKEEIPPGAPIINKN